MIILNLKGLILKVNNLLINKELNLLVQDSTFHLLIRKVLKVLTNDLNLQVNKVLKVLINDLNLLTLKEVNLVIYHKEVNLVISHNEVNPLTLNK